MGGFIEYTDKTTGQLAFVRKNVVAAIVPLSVGGTQIVIAPSGLDDRREWGNLLAVEDAAEIHSRITSLL